jgi:hypothetical protein
MHKKVPFLTCLLGLPLASFAQTATTSPQFYVGVGANLLTDVPGNSAAVPKLLGPSLTAGLQLAPRLAVQVSAAYHWDSQSTTSSSYYYGSGGGTVGGYTSYAYYKYLTVPVLLRYTLTEPVGRFHVDGLAGVTVLRSYFNFISNDPLSSYYYYPNNYSSSRTKANATLGPALRYTLSPNLDVTANGLVSAVLGGTYTHFSDRLFLNVLVGAHYIFN